MGLTDDLQRLGIKPEQVLSVNGKPLSDASPKKPRSPYKSNAEQLYARKLEGMLASGEIVSWAYEAVTLVVVDANGERCRYTPDFMIVLPSGLELHEVKGHLREAARIRFLGARERYPFWTFRMFRRNGNGWDEIL